jgi:hypothetical protein
MAALAAQLRRAHELQERHIEGNAVAAKHMGVFVPSLEKLRASSRQTDVVDTARGC